VFICQLGLLLNCRSIAHRDSDDVEFRLDTVPLKLLVFVGNMHCPSLFSTTVLSNSQIIHVPIETAIQKLQDPKVLFSESPIVVAYTQSPSDPDTYTVTEKVPVLNCFSFTTQFPAKFSKLPNGVETQVAADLGTTLINRWTLTPADGGGLLLTEQDTVTVSHHPSD
jgi:hypothetical protein